MKKTGFLIFILASISGTSALAAPPLLPVQGYVAASDGSPVDGNRSVTFGIYESASGGVAEHTEIQTIGFTDGNFVAYLGENPQLDPNLFNGAPPLWLGMTIQGDTEMQPRVQLGSAPSAGFSHNAGFADMCGDAAALGGKVASDFAPISHPHDGDDISFTVSGRGVGGDPRYYLPPLSYPTQTCNDPVTAKFCAVDFIAINHYASPSPTDPQGASCNARTLNPGEWELCANTAGAAIIQCSMRCID